ncbi:uncharacterized protein LOC128559228 [Mercenaria mercenaria]|uniref:uncharacterized protein LOC128559228 n=1 Tax=Mercenaria mercenaria TaxID=6596 RepID=UPI00234EE594|nr:uncharacterized protein LOC128559228 [Mercenaria mercenaria]
MNETDESCLVYFEDYKVIGNVVKQRHELRGKILDVKCFQRALGRAEGEKERTLQIPRPIEVQNINLYKVKFVANSEDKRKAIERELCKHYVDIKWPSGNTQNVQLICTLSTDVKGCFKIAKDWGKQAHSRFISHMDGFVFHRVEVLHDIKEKVIEFLKTVNITNPSNVAIIIENEQRTIIIVGQKEEADNLKETVESSINQIIEQEEKERHKVKDTLTNLKPVELKLLEAQRFSQALENNFQDLNVHVNAEKCEILFEGMIGSVQGAKLKIFETRSSFTSGRVQNVPKLSATLYKNEETIEFIQHQLKADGIIAVWEVSDTALDICCTVQKINILEQYGGFEVRGLNKGVQDAYTHLFKLLSFIKQKQHTISKPGIVEHVRSSKGKDSINIIENNLSCDIVVEGDEAFKQMTEKIHGSGVQASCRVFDTRSICAWQGDMTELEVDMIINPSDKGLRFVGGLGKAIISKGGKSIQYEWTYFIGSHGALQDDDVFIGRGGNLKAKHIAHIKSQEWKQGQDKEKILEASVIKCLQEASKIQVSSIAIPAIGCGAKAFPVDISTTCIVSALRKVFLEYQDSSVTEVYLSDMNTKNVEGFTHALMQTFGRSNVMMSDAEIPSPLKIYSENNAQSSTFVTLQGICQHKDGTVAVGNISVTLIKGEIAKQKADVIVNTTAFNLDLRNELSLLHY